MPCVLIDIVCPEVLHLLEVSGLGIFPGDVQATIDVHRATDEVRRVIAASVRLDILVQFLPLQLL